MQSTRTLVLRTIIFLAALSLVACGSGSTTGQTTGGTPTATPTAPPKNKPTTVPTLTMAFCQRILSIAEANQTMQPPTPATSIRVDSTSRGGSCNYEYKPFNSVVTVTFLPYPGATDPQSEQAGLAAAANQITSSVPGATVHTTQVSGVGDTALFIAATATTDGITIHQDALDTIYGQVLISCANFNAGSASDAAQLSALQQVAKLVVTRV